MTQTELLVVPPVAMPTDPVGGLSSSIGRSVRRLTPPFMKRTSTRSTKKMRPLHGQTAKQISVVIPTHCRSLLLKNCLQALVDQSFDKNFFEIIVVSDGADGETKLMVDSFKGLHPSIYYLHLPEKKGPAAARNFGWQRAWGKLIAFTDDDCLPEQDWLSCLYKTYKGEREIAYAGRVRGLLSPQPTDHEKNVSNRETVEFVTANCCCTKEALECVGGFDERFSMAWREDSDLEFKMLEKHIPVVSVEEALVLHPVRETKWGSIREQKKGIFNALLYKKFPELYRKKIQEGPQWNYYMIAVSVLCFVISLFCHLKFLSLVFATFWIILTIDFTATRRLGQTAKTLRHIGEMIITSIVIPFVSLYWQLYGAIKYKTLFL